MALAIGAGGGLKKEVDPQAKQKIVFKTADGSTYASGAEGNKKIAEPEVQDTGYSYDPGTTNPEPSFDESVSEPPQEAVKPPEPNYDTKETGAEAADTTTADTTTVDAWNKEKEDTTKKAEESKPIVYTGGALGKTTTGSTTATTGSGSTSASESVSGEQWLYDDETWQKAYEAGLRRGNPDKNAGTKSGSKTGTASTPKTSAATGTTATSTGAGNRATTGGNTQLDFKNEQTEAADRNAVIEKNERGRENFIANREADREAFDKAKGVVGNFFSGIKNWYDGYIADALLEPAEYHDKKNDQTVRVVPDSYGGADVYVLSDKNNHTSNDIDPKTGIIVTKQPEFTFAYHVEDYPNPNTEPTSLNYQPADNRLLPRPLTNTGTGTTTTGTTTGSTNTGTTATGSTTGSTSGTTAGTEEEFKKEAADNYRSGAAGEQRYDARKAGTGNGNSGTTKPPAGSEYFIPSYGQDMDKGVKAPYRTEGYSAAELEAFGNKPRSDTKYYDDENPLVFEGYYLAPNGKYYPVDQTKYEYWKRNGYNYKGWEEGMRDYWNTYGTFYGYGKRKNYGGGGGGYRYYGGSGGSYYGGSGSSGSSNNSNGLYYNPNTSWSI